jgi:hypothetical protein
MMEQKRYRIDKTIQKIIEIYNIMTLVKKLQATDTLMLSHKFISIGWDIVSNKCQNISYGLNIGTIY